MKIQTLPGTFEMRCFRNDESSLRKALEQKIDVLVDFFMEFPVVVYCKTEYLNVLIYLKSTIQGIFL